MNHKSGTKNWRSISNVLPTLIILVVSVVLGVEIVIAAPVDASAQVNATPGAGSGQSCITMGGIWNSGTNSCTLNTNLTLGAGNSLTLDSRIISTVTNTITNYGTITITHTGGIIEHNGTINNLGTINITNYGTIINNGVIWNAGTITNYGIIIGYSSRDTDYSASGGYIWNAGTITNKGTITNTNGTIDNNDTITNTNDGTINNGGDILIISGGTITTDSGSVINNKGTITNVGTINNGGAIINTGGVSEKATITYSGMASTASITINSGGAITNTGAITNIGTITINDKGTITNYGIITNTNGTIDKTNGYFSNLFGVINNYGYIDNTNNGVINNNLMGTINNDNMYTNGTIANKGTINNYGYIDNTGTITKFCGGDITGSPITPRLVINMCNPTPTQSTSTSSQPQSSPSPQTSSLQTTASTPPASTSKIPDWVKTTAKWCGEGQISESDFIKAIQYLIDHKILAISSNVSCSMQNTTNAVVNHYQINNDCQLVNAEFSDSNIGPSYQTFAINVHQTMIQLGKDEYQNNTEIASSAAMMQVVVAKLYKQAYFTEIHKLENSFILNPSFEQEFTNNFFYATTFNGQDLTVNMIQEFNLTAPTLPSQAQLQNDPDCKELYSMIKASVVKK